jgi:hypothetical protein
MTAKPALHKILQGILYKEEDKYNNKNKGKNKSQQMSS